MEEHLLINAIFQDIKTKTKINVARVIKYYNNITVIYNFGKAIYYYDTKKLLLDSKKNNNYKTIMLSIHDPELLDKIVDFLNS